MIKVYQSISLCNTLSLVLPFGQAKLAVDFEGGNVSRGKHATFYTNDPFKQRVLDKSEQNGQLYRLIRSIPEAEDGQKPKTAAVKKTPGAQPSMATQVFESEEARDEAARKVAEEAVKAFLARSEVKGTNHHQIIQNEGEEHHEGNEGAEAETTSPGEDAYNTEAPETPDEAENPAPAPSPSKGTTMKDMKFAEAGEVIVYVMEHYGEAVTDVEAATKILRKHKINPVY